AWVCVLSLVAAMATEKLAAPDLIQLAKKSPKSAQLRDAIAASLPADEIQKGVAVVSQGPEFLFAVESAGTPALYVDDQPIGKMVKLPGENLWVGTRTLRTGISHSFYYMVDGKKFGGRTDVPAYGPDSFQQAGVPQGKLSEKIVHTSK